MNKLLGLALIALGALVMLYVAVLILLTKGGVIVICGVVPMVAGWVLFNMKSNPPRTLKEEFEHARALSRKFFAKFSNE